MLTSVSPYCMALEPIAGTLWTCIMGVPLWLSATAFQAGAHTPPLFGSTYALSLG